MTDEGRSGLSLDVFAKLHAAIGGLSERMDKSRRATERAIRQAELLMPFYGRHSANAIAPSSGLTVIDLGGPTQGSMRLPAMVVVGGILPTTAAAGRVDLYVTKHPPGAVAAAGSLALMDWAGGFAAMPAVGTYSARQIVVKENERLLAVISNGTNGQQYVGTCWYTELIESPATREGVAI